MEVINFATYLTNHVILSVIHHRQKTLDPKEQVSDEYYGLEVCGPKIKSQY
jgi:hypothetical protein